MIEDEYVKSHLNTLEQARELIYAVRMRYIDNETIQKGFDITINSLTRNTMDIEEYALNKPGPEWSLTAQEIKPK